MENNQKKKIYNQIHKELKKYKSTERKKKNESFFKMKKGNYAEKDVFLGVSVPNIRKVAKKFQNKIKINDLKEIIKSKYNEERLIALIFLVEKYKNKKTTKKEKGEIYLFLIKNIEYINNWNLVDLVVPRIISDFIFHNPKELKRIKSWINSKSLWKRRVVVLSTWCFIKNEKNDFSLNLLKNFLNDQEDLIQKSLGWMFREIWKINPKKLETFLIQNYNKISRTSLRYSIEKMEPKKRLYFLNLKK